MINVSRREKYAVTIAVIAVCILILVQYVINPFNKKRDRAGRSLKVKTEQLHKIKTLKSEYDTLFKEKNADSRQFNRQNRNFDLFSFVNKTAKNAKLKDNTQYTKPSTKKIKDSPFIRSNVEIKFQAIDLKQLAPFIYSLENSSNGVYVKKMTVSRKSKSGLLDVVALIETLEKKKE